MSAVITRADLLAVEGRGSWGKDYTEVRAHAADPTTGEDNGQKRGIIIYRSLCGRRGMQPMGGAPSFDAPDQCARCRAIADKRYPKDAPAPASVVYPLVVATRRQLHSGATMPCLTIETLTASEHVVDCGFAGDAGVRILVEKGARLAELLGVTFENRIPER